MQSLKHPSCFIQSLGAPCRITPCPRKHVNKTNMFVWRKCRAHLRVQKIFGASLKIGVSVSTGVLGTAVETVATCRRGTTGICLDMAFLLSYPSRDESELFFKITWVCIHVVPSLWQGESLQARSEGLMRKPDRDKHPEVVVMGSIARNRFFRGPPTGSLIRPLDSLISWEFRVRRTAFIRRSEAGKGRWCSLLEL